MTDSYHRQCKKCGRLIQLRRMPGGQWVAWEGFDVLHKCDAPPPPKHRWIEKNAKNEVGNIGSLEFREFDIKATKINCPDTRPVSLSAGSGSHQNLGRSRATSSQGSKRPDRYGDTSSGTPHFNKIQAPHDTSPASIYSRPKRSAKETIKSIFWSAFYLAIFILIIKSCGDK
jgi:hypothetical protein